jgi:hypothetical protein
MKIFAMVLLLGASAICAAAEPEGEVVAAGPFRVTVPKAFAKDAVVEKVAICPVYTAEHWARKQSDPRMSLKGGYENRPQHWAICLPKAASWYEIDPKTAGSDATAPQILIHKADEWVAIGEDGKVNAVTAAKEVARMRKDLALWLKQPVNRVSPGYMDASTSFDCLKKKITFNGGSGVRGIVQWTIEQTFARRGELHYLFLGLSDDGTCQIIATFPLDLPGLPKESDDLKETKHLGYSMKDYPKFMKQFPAYESAVKKWLTAHPAEFTPKLEELDAMMSSLVVKRWE